MSESLFPDWDSFPVKYATCTIDTKSRLVQMRWIGYHFKPHGDLVKQYMLIGADQAYDEIVEEIDAWSTAACQVSHRLTFEEGDLLEDNPIPFHTTNLRRGCAQMKGLGLLSKWVCEQLEETTALQHQLNELDLTKLTINLQEELSGGYWSVVPIQDAHYLVPFVTPSRSFFSNQWVEHNMLNTTLEVNGYETFTYTPEGKSFPEDIECAEYSPAKGDDFHTLRIYKKVGNQFHYFSTYASQELWPYNASPPDVHISHYLLPHPNQGALSITLLNSAKNLLDQYEPKISPKLLRLPKKEGVEFFMSDGRGLVINFDRDKIVGRQIVHNGLCQGYGECGFEIPLEEITDKEGFITSRAINKYYKQVAKNLTESYGNMASSVGIDEHIYNHSDENGDIETANNTQGRVLTAALINVKHGFLKMPAECYDNLSVVEDEDLKDLFLYSLKALLLLRTPSVKETIKKDTADYIKTLAGRKKATVKKDKRRFWGSDKITYLYPKTGRKGAKGRGYHFVMGFVRTLPTGRLTDVKPHYRGDLALGTSASELMFGKPEGNAGYSQVSLKWLKSVENKLGRSLQHAEQGGEYHIPLANGRHYKVDGYDKETKTIYEFHGDYYHGNPAIYGPDEVNTTTNKTMGELYEATKQREEFLRTGHNLVVMWESEWHELKKVTE